MGYTTDFEGTFTLNKPLTQDIILTMRDLCDDAGGPGTPGRYCQWVPTKDGMGIDWDTGEKFYDYVPWIRYLAKWLGSQGYLLNGSVTWAGEERRDIGTIVIKDNDVRSVAGVLEYVPNWDVPATTREQAETGRR